MKLSNIVVLVILVLIDIGWSFALPNKNCRASITQYEHQTYNDGNNEYSIWDVNIYSQGSHTINNITLQIVPPTNNAIIKTWGISLQSQGGSSFKLPSFSSIKIGSMYNFGYLISGTNQANISISDISCHLPLEKSCNVTLSSLNPIEIQNNDVNNDESVHLLYKLNFTNTGENLVSKAFIQVSFPDFSTLVQYFGMEKTCCTQIKSEATFEVSLLDLKKNKVYDDAGFILRFNTRHSKFDNHPNIILTGIECKDH